MRLEIWFPDITSFFKSSYPHGPQPLIQYHEVWMLSQKREACFALFIALSLDLRWKLWQWLVGMLLSLKRRILVSKLLNTCAYTFNTQTRSRLRLFWVCPRTDLWFFLYFPYQNWVRKYIVVSLFTEVRYSALALREWCWQEGKLDMACSLLQKLISCPHFSSHLHPFENISSA